MGSYGIGVSRLVGAIIEAHHDEKGIAWPFQVAPFKINIIVSDELLNDDNISKLYSFLIQKYKDVILDDKEFELPDEDDLREAIENQGIHIQRIEIGDSETVLEFSDYDDFGAMNSESWYNKRFETICDLFGFGSYDLDYRRATVTFEY